MRRLINVRMGEGDKQETVEAVLWINETPPSCRRGKNRKQKSRRYKRQQQALIVERRLEFRSQIERLIPDY